MKKTEKNLQTIENKQKILEEKGIEIDIAELAAQDGCGYVHDMTDIHIMSAVALAESAGDIGNAAELLGISESNIQKYVNLSNVQKLVKKLINNKIMAMGTAQAWDVVCDVMSDAAAKPGDRLKAAKLAMEWGGVGADAAAGHGDLASMSVAELERIVGSLQRQKAVDVKD